MTSTVRHNLIRIMIHPNPHGSGSATTFAWQSVELRRPRGSFPDAIQRVACDACEQSVDIAVMSEDGLRATKRKSGFTGLVLIAAAVGGLLWAFTNVIPFTTHAAWSWLVSVVGAIIAVVGLGFLVRARNFDGIIAADATHRLVHDIFNPLTCERCGYKEELPNEVTMEEFRALNGDRKLRFDQHACNPLSGQPE